LPDLVIEQVHRLARYVDGSHPPIEEAEVNSLEFGGQLIQSYARRKIHADGAPKIAGEPRTAGFAAMSPSD
jgi:hypothetical protein